MTLKHPEIFQVSESKHQVYCTAGGASGHPKVYYTFEGKTEAVCGYCSRLFTKRPMAGAKPLREAA